MGLPAGEDRIKNSAARASFRPSQYSSFSTEEGLSGTKQIRRPWGAGWSGACEWMTCTRSISPRRVFARVNHGDTETILSVYDDSFADMSFGMPSFHYSDARDIFGARLTRLFRHYKVAMKMMIIDVVLNGDRALDWSTIVNPSPIIHRTLPLQSSDHGTRVPY
jgi:hypothetical protein